MLDDGVAGLRAIRDAGGKVIVQDPDDAAFPELPSRALVALSPDRVLPVDGIVGALHVMIRDQVVDHTVPHAIALEAALDRKVKATPEELARLGPQSAIACPECSGPTWQIGEEDNRRYRCYLGHVVTARELLVQGAIEIEAALWSAVRALNERAMTLETLAKDSERSGNPQSAAIYQSRAAETRTQADVARQFMLDLMQPK
jgi:two-component system, chemotaxis family, protein-glutamate methylesterase/glutaminase